MTTVPSERIRRLNEQPCNARGAYVLYWMIANRRPSWNYSLDRAIEWAEELNKPLVILEALRCRYRWASDRIHRFVLQGMADNRASFRDTPIRYYAYVEPSANHGSGLLQEFAAKSAVVVTDDFPCFFLRRMPASVATRVPVAMEAVDSNGILPLRATDRVFSRAFDFRRWLQKNLPPHLMQAPRGTPLHQLDIPSNARISPKIANRWPEASDKMLQANTEQLRELPIDHDVGPAAFPGGTQAAQRALDSFLADRLNRYAEARNDVQNEVASRLSPYLHFGHVSAHEVFDRVIRHESWNPTRLSTLTKGAREGWWGMSPASEAFLDQLITWRELGYNFCWQRDDYDRFESLPEWAQKSLEKHASDSRSRIYDCDEFESANTHNPLWNAAQRQLVREGRMHNYLRMVWGKKILEWSESPQQALQTMIHLNNKYAVDGRNPNSYSGIFWVLGRYDRAWGPERPVFGKIRYMSTDNTARKLKVKEYLQQYASW